MYKIDQQHTHWHEKASQKYQITKSPDGQNEILVTVVIDAKLQACTCFKKHSDINKTKNHLEIADQPNKGDQDRDDGKI